MAAATARIFVWDSTDMVVVSDIDGTITKYVLFYFSSYVLNRHAGLMGLDTYLP